MERQRSCVLPRRRAKQREHRSARGQLGGEHLPAPPHPAGSPQPSRLRKFPRPPAPESLLHSSDAPRRQDPRLLRPRVDSGASGQVLRARHSQTSPALEQGALQCSSETPRPQDTLLLCPCPRLEKCTLPALSVLHFDLVVISTPQKSRRKPCRKDGARSPRGPLTQVCQCLHSALCHRPSPSILPEEEKRSPAEPRASCPNQDS